MTAVAAGVTTGRRHPPATSASCTLAAGPAVQSPNCTSTPSDDRSGRCDCRRVAGSGPWLRRTIPALHLTSHSMVTRPSHPPVRSLDRLAGLDPLEDGDPLADGRVGVEEPVVPALVVLQRVVYAHG